MSQLPLPEDLKNRLLAAGVKDNASLYAALDADPNLRAVYQDWLFNSVIHAFADTKDREELLALSEQVPLLTSQDFISTVQKGIDRALNAGDYETAEALRQRLDALKEIQAMKAYDRQPPLARAVIAFVQAAHEEAARQIFEKYKDLLDSDEAEEMLAQEFEAEDEKARSFLRRRGEMLHDLRNHS